MIVMDGMIVELEVAGRKLSLEELAEVAEAFLTYLDAHPDMPPGPLASFVWVASKLPWIKSQALLPRHVPSYLRTSRRASRGRLRRASPRLDAHRLIVAGSRALRR